MREAQIILNRLLDRYENSKHLSEPNASKRRVMLRISKKELPEYDYESAAVRDAYNDAARELEQQALVQLEWVRERTVLSAVILNLNQVMRCYEQAGRMHPRERAERIADLVTQSLAHVSVPWIAAWRDEVCEAARERMRIPTFCKENDRLLRDVLLAFRKYAALSGGVTMRAFSSQCFCDTKYFERHVCDVFLQIARKHCKSLSEVEQETELGKREQLALLGIYARPELYELSGTCVLETRRGRIDVGAAEPCGIALPSTLVEQITEIDLGSIHCVTLIENKTNYDEYLLDEKQPNELVVYHGGFSSPQKRKFFALLAAVCPKTAQVRFWADIDLGGFRMFEHLQDIFPQAVPMRMDGHFVEQYHENGLSRSGKYITELEEEWKAGRYPLFDDAIRAIIKYGVTIEQEAFLN